MSAPNERPEDGESGGERIAKVIARSGLCSRRDAEILIGEKRVSVNGVAIESAALDVSPSDAILVDGKPLAKPEPPRLWRYHKPKGRVTTHKDPEGRPTVFEALPENLPRLISIGRLDYNTEGLLLLTNDGDLARHLELPSTGWTRRYRVRAFGQIEQEQLDALAGGLRTGGVNYGPIDASLEREQGDNVWITLAIREGKNREVRRIMEHLGLTVNRLIRVSFGPFMLGDLETGAIEEVKIAVLKDQLGARLARQLGVKREPLREERRLPPSRSKPTYLRRKPAAPERPVRSAEDRPMRQRRVFSMDGSEPTTELVPEKRRRPDHFGAGQGSERPRRFSREDRPEREERERRPRREKPEYGAANFASDRKPRIAKERKDAEGHATERKSDRGDRPRFRPRDGEAGERQAHFAPDRKPRFAKDRGDAEGKAAPQRRFQSEDRPRSRPRDGEGAEHRERSRPASREGARRERPAAEGEERPRKFAPRKPGEERGERPAWKARSKEGEERSERPAGKTRREHGEERPRSDFKRPPGKGRPFKDREDGKPREFRAEGGKREEGQFEKRFPRKPRADEASGDARKPRSFEKRPYNKGPRREGSPERESGGKPFTRREAAGGEKPFKKREASGGGKPFKRREGETGGKPFKRREGPAKGPRPGGPRKPRPKSDKDES
jgi:23S rRNA pseudouridine2605 synthase